MNKVQLIMMILVFSSISFAGGYWTREMRKEIGMPEENETISSEMPISMDKNEGAVMQTDDQKESMREFEDRNNPPEKIATKNEIKSGADKQIKTSSVAGVRYINEKYKFETVFPKGWDNYKAEEKDGKIEISLPVKNSEYQLGVGVEGNSYMPIVDILFWNNSDWKKYLEDCSNEPSPNCFSMESITAKNDEYVFIVTTSFSALPQISFSSNQGEISGDYVQIIKNSFKVID